MLESLNSCVGGVLKHEQVHSFSNDESQQGRQGYKQTKWAAIVDLVQYFVTKEFIANEGYLVDPRTKALGEWAEWVIDDGYKYSDEVIHQKRDDLLLILDPDGASDSLEQT